VFAGLSLLGKLRTPAFDANLWWIDLRVLPGGLADGLVALLAVLLLVWSGRVRSFGRFRVPLLTLLIVFVAATLANAGVFWWLLAQGRIQTSVPVPLSLLFGAVLMFIAWHVGRDTGSTHRPAQLVSCALCFAVFPALQCVGFGKTDYRRAADVAVVFGARAYADGRASDALADRVRTACQLHRQGLVGRLIFSGGPGDGAVHETESMRRMAVSLGVPDSAILRDEAGLSTAATLRNVRPLLAGHSAIAVSEFYHLPRIKLACQRTGIDIRTVPARPAHWARSWPLASMAREIPAFWLYYLRALAA
jgi:uncharacterized SAM-binding protein YcdF (DUF218 family)